MRVTAAFIIGVVLGALAVFFALPQAETAVWREAARCNEELFQCDTQRHWCMAGKVAGRGSASHAAK